MCVWEWGAKEYIWAYDGLGNVGMGKMRHFMICTQQIFGSSHQEERDGRGM